MRNFVFLLAVAAVTALTSSAAAVPRVLASIKPVHSLAASVMEGVGQPELLIGGAASEHGYSLKPSDARKIAQADVIFWIGPDLETYLIASVQSLAPKAKRVELEHAKGVELLPARRSGVWAANDEEDRALINPHIWLSPDNAMAMTRAMAEALSASDPANAKRYQTNAAKTVAALERLKRAIAAELAPVRGRRYVVFHDAYQYFEHAFGLSPIGTVTVAPDRPEGPRTVAALRHLLLSGQAACIFEEPQFSPALVTSLAEGTKARIGVLDPLGADLAPGPGLYPALMSNLARSLKDCLGAPNR
ncbi:MAG TPA: zinc ABC transporter substrate-binding protein [Rhizomicrobium sp.]|jgi:zinc transport system substrate-binding protein